MRLKLLTLAFAVVITGVFRLIGSPDISRVVTAFLTGGGIASGTVADVSGFIIAVCIWWALAYFIATRARPRIQGRKER